MDKLKELVLKLKDYNTRFGSLDVKEIADFMSIKNVILNKAGIVCSNELLAKSEDEIINTILTGFAKKKRKKEEEQQEIKESIEIMKNEESKYIEEISKNIDNDIKDEDINEETKIIEQEMKSKSRDVVDYIESGVDDDYRNKIRSQIITKEEIVVNIKRGKLLNIKTNASMTRIDIEIPSSFKIDIEQSLLLNLYDKIFGGKKDSEGPSNPYLDKDLIEGIKITDDDKKDVKDTLATKIESVENNTASSSIPSNVLDIVNKSSKPVNNDNKTERKSRKVLEDKSGKLTDVERKYVKEKEIEIKENYDSIEHIDPELIFKLFDDLKDYYKVRNLLKKTYKVSYGEVGQIIINKLKELNLSKEELIRIGLKENTKTFKAIYEEF